MCKEIWKDIPNYEGLYQASSYGQIKSLINNRNNYREKILRQTKDKDGYFKVILSKNKHPKSFRVHRLIYETFNTYIPFNMVCRHMDGNNQNNCIENLAIGTVSDNEKDKIKHGTHNKGSRNGRSKINNLIVRIIRHLIKYDMSEEYIGKIFGVSHSIISMIKLNKIWTHVK